MEQPNMRTNYEWKNYGIPALNSEIDILAGLRGNNDVGDAFVRTGRSLSDSCHQPVNVKHRYHNGD
jgi:hypothetical protein